MRLLRVPVMTIAACYCPQCPQERGRGCYSARFRRFRMSSDSFSMISPARVVR